MKDLKLDVERHDLLVEDFDLSLVTDLERVRQNLNIRLWFFFREWFLDGTAGVRFYEYIMLKNPNLVTVASLVKATIIDTKDVFSILEYDQSFDAVSRKLTVNFTVNTTFGQLTFTGESL